MKISETLFSLEIEAGFIFTRVIYFVILEKLGSFIIRNRLF